MFQQKRVCKNENLLSYLEEIFQGRKIVKCKIDDYFPAEDLELSDISAFRVDHTFHSYFFEKYIRSGETYHRGYVKVKGIYVMFDAESCHKIHNYKWSVCDNDTFYMKRLLLDCEEYHSFRRINNEAFDLRFCNYRVFLKRSHRVEISRHVNTDEEIRALLYREHSITELGLEGDKQVLRMTFDEGVHTEFYADDFHLICMHKWNVNDEGYVSCTRRNGEMSHISMHRTILEVADNKVCDHIDNNRRNNRRDNLRVATRKENAQNRAFMKTNTSGFTGVNIVGSRLSSKKWITLIKGYSKNHINFENAVIDRLEKEVTIMGEFAPTQHKYLRDMLENREALVEEIQKLYPEQCDMHRYYIEESDTDEDEGDMLLLEDDPDDEIVDVPDDEIFLVDDNDIRDYLTNTFPDQELQKCKIDDYYPYDQTPLESISAFQVENANRTYAFEKYLRHGEKFHRGYTFLENIVVMFDAESVHKVINREWRVNSWSKVIATRNIYMKSLLVEATKFHRVMKGNDNMFDLRSCNLRLVVTRSHREKIAAKIDIVPGIREILYRDTGIQKMGVEDGHQILRMVFPDGRYTEFWEEDFHLICMHNWCISSNGYCLRSRENDKSVSMHRLILDAPDDMFCDHIDNDRRNNRRSNLRLSTCGENTVNQKLSVRNTSGFQGVSIRSGSWATSISRNGYQYAKSHRSFENAVIDRLEKEVELMGDFAPTEHKYLRDLLGDKKKLRSEIQRLYPRQCVFR